jgi:isopentenyl diphosphate isomerase/L-lactate dehydrogenase-like FMN-dependent dehydrogenase
MTWKELSRIRAGSRLPLILKGVATGEDARLAVDHGVDVIYVSNHGGHALDHGRATIDILPEAVEAVGGRADVMMDGGVLRGTDVIKALALGARAVAIGKLLGWGLAASGESGVLNVLEILRDELTISMANLGVTSIGDIGPSHVCPAPPVEIPDEMSAFPALPGGRQR